jgi:hypothetical protein
MRRPRDFDAELKALTDRARQLKEQKLRQLGELVIATGADALDTEILVGALLAAVSNKDSATGDGWQKAGAGFFQRQSRRSAAGPQPNREGTLPLDAGPQSPARNTGAA